MLQRATSSRTSLIALAALVSALAGCSREQTPAPLPRLQAAPAAGVASPAPALPPRTKEQAMSALMSLPELKAWSVRLEQSSGGAVHGALIEYDPAPKLIDGKRYWQFSFVENGSDAAHRWESFLVAERGDEILVEDFAADRAMTLEQWRKDKRPLERTGAPAQP